MRKWLKKILSVRFSELFIVAIISPAFLASVTTGTNFQQEILPPPDPQIETITVHPDLNIITIEGHTGFADEILWLDDQTQGEVIQLVTNKEGYFIATLDNSHLANQGGEHTLVAYVGATRIKTPLLKSNKVVYTIDKDYNVSLDLKQSSGVTLLTNSLFAVESEKLQNQYQQKTIVTRNDQPIYYNLVSYKGVVLWHKIVIIIAYTAMLLIIIYALRKRWLRKKALNQSFWSMGRGVYIKSRPSKDDDTQTKSQ